MLYYFISAYITTSILRNYYNSYCKNKSIQYIIFMFLEVFLLNIILYIIYNGLGVLLYESNWRGIFHYWWFCCKSRIYNKKTTKSIKWNANRKFTKIKTYRFFPGTERDEKTIHQLWKPLSSDGGTEWFDVTENAAHKMIHKMRSRYLSIKI